MDKPTETKKLTKYGFSRRRRLFRKLRINITAEYLFVFSILGALALGAALGAGRASLASEGEMARLSAKLSRYALSFPGDGYISGQSFAECVIKYGRNMVIIWFLSFIPAAAAGSYLLLVSRGMSIGFSTAMLLRIFEGRGMLMASVLYLPQNLVLVPGYVLISYFSLVKGLALITKNEGRLKIYGSAYRLSEYIIVLIIGLSTVVLASGLEIYFIPWLFQSVI